MADYTFEDLKSKTVAQLREIAQELDHPSVQGYSTMHKAPLLHGLCEAYGIEEHVHHEVVGIDKGKIKKQIKALKVKRAAALDAHDSVELKKIRRQIRGLKREIKKHTI